MLRKIEILTTLLSVLLLCFATNSMAAESAVADEITAEKFIVKWSLIGTGPKLDGEMRKAKQSWEFKSDGTVKSIVSGDRRAADTFEVTVKYKVEKGMLYVQRAGSKTRWNRFMVIELKESDMTLKGSIEGYMLFKRG